jgi:hypothetical protein
MDPHTRQIIANLYEELHAYAMNTGTWSDSVWNALKNARTQLWPDLGPDPDDPRTQDQDNDQDQDQ